MRQAGDAPTRKSGGIDGRTGGRELFLPCRLWIRPADVNYRHTCRGDLIGMRPGAGRSVSPEFNILACFRRSDCERPAKPEFGNRHRDHQARARGRRDLIQTHTSPIDTAVKHNLEPGQTGNEIATTVRKVWLQPRESYNLGVESEL